MNIMLLTDKQIIARLIDALKLAEATFIKINPSKMEEKVWSLDAIKEIGKVLAIVRELGIR